MKFSLKACQFECWRQWFARASCIVLCCKVWKLYSSFSQEEFIYLAPFACCSPLHGCLERTSQLLLLPSLSAFPKYLVQVHLLSWQIISIRSRTWVIFSLPLGGYIPPLLASGWLRGMGWNSRYSLCMLIKCNDGKVSCFAALSLCIRTCNSLNNLYVLKPIKITVVLFRANL